jgi:SagB-type dehydrogenase family enzyme
MRIRRSSSIIAYFAGSRICVFNFLRGMTFACNPTALGLLSSLDRWTKIDQASELLGTRNTASLRKEIEGLLQLGGLVAHGTEAAREDQEYRSIWKWDLVAGVYHFGVMDPDWSTESEAQDFYRRQRKNEAIPPLYTGRARDSAIPLAKWSDDGVLRSTMSARRSKREFSGSEIKLRDLAQCLYSGLGIVKVVNDRTLGPTVFKMTPSGGARNPLEGYVYSVNVKGLSPGLYHYSGREHCLHLIRSGNLPKPSELLAGQSWTNQASAVIFLVANFPRTMWKYPHPSAYRAVFIESGHIAQNILLMAQHLKLAATPTAAFYGSRMCDMLSLQRIPQSTVYAIVIGHDESTRKVRSRLR